jgi:signal transduction histidine kinase
VTEFPIEVVIEVHGTILSTALATSSPTQSSQLVTAATSVLSELMVAYRFASQWGTPDSGSSDAIKDLPTEFIQFRPGGVLDRDPPVDLYQWLTQMVGDDISQAVRTAVGQHRIAMFEASRSNGADHISLIVCSFHDGGGIIGIRDINDLVENRERAFQRRKLASIGQLASSMAHELNNLLQPIVSMAQMASQDYPADPELEEMLTIILNSANQAARIVQGMLLYGRRSPTKPRQLSLAEAAAQQLDVLRRTLPTGIRVDFHSIGAATRVAVDFGELGQIIKNLLSNAIHVLDGHGTVTVTIDELQVSDAAAVHMQIPSGRYGRLSISDNGPGIPSGLLDQVFEPFFTTKGIGQGTGLGLSIVQGIVRSCGGTIVARNLPAGGAAFDIVLPSVAMDYDALQGGAKERGPDPVGFGLRP